MKSIINRASLLKPLGHVQSVVERRNTIPILSNVLLGFNQLSTDEKWKKISALRPTEDIISEIKYEINKLVKNI